MWTDIIWLGVFINELLLRNRFASANLGNLQLTRKLIEMSAAASYRDDPLAGRIIPSFFSFLKTKCGLFAAYVFFSSLGRRRRWAYRIIVFCPHWVCSRWRFWCFFSSFLDVFQSIPPGDDIVASQWILALPLFFLVFLLSCLFFLFSSFSSTHLLRFKYQNIGCIDAASVDRGVFFQYSQKSFASKFWIFWGHALIWRF